MRYDPDHKQKTRARVLEEAARAIRKDGPEKIGVAEVMQRAGLTHGGFYAHFKNKDDLVVHAIEQMCNESSELFQATTQDKAPGEGLAFYIRSYLSRTHCYQRDIGCPFAAIGTDVPRLSIDARIQYERGAARMAAAIAEKLRAMDQADSGSLAVSVLAEMVGALMLARSISDEERSIAMLTTTRNQLLRRLGLENMSRLPHRYVQ